MPNNRLPILGAPGTPIPLGRVGGCLSCLAGLAGLAGWLAGDPVARKASSTERAAADWHVRGPQNGLGWAGWAGLGWLAGWLAGLQAVSNSVPESSVPFGRGPPAVGRSQ